VNSELEQLLVLQDRQQKIRQIQAEIETVPLRRTSLEAQLAASASAVDALKQQARQVEVDRKRLELDVGTRTESISRLKTQQYQTRKNDEFQAMGHEIERYENEIRKIEDEELELMVQVDKIKADLAEEEKKAAGPIVHYAYGTGIGALYGGLVQKYETIRSGFGSAYGVATWALGDEVAVPALGLGKKPTETPVSEHFQTLAAHLVYGITLEGVRRLAMKVL